MQNNSQTSANSPILRHAHCFVVALILFPALGKVQEEEEEETVFVDPEEAEEAAEARLTTACLISVPAI